MFMNCSDQTLTYNITNFSEDDALNGTLLFLVDNTGLFPPDYSTATQTIKLILEFQVIVQINEEDKAKLFMICSLTGVVILIMVIFAVILNCRIRRFDRQI
jgi:hypothetical protein